MAKFKYVEICRQKTEVRLVRLQPNISDGQICLDLKHVSLGDSPAFQALSYTWGDFGSCATIMVNGQSLTITQNLHSALFHLQKAGVTAWLWIDALSIDQMNHVEKGWQVSLMGRIFGCASRVVTWLGRESDDSSLLFESVRAIGPEALKLGVLGLWTRDPNADLSQTSSPSEKIMFQFLVRIANDEFIGSQRYLNAVNAILNRPYWSRMWIIQEVALARDGIILCGCQEVPLADFYATMTALFFARTTPGVRLGNTFGSELRLSAFRLTSLAAHRELQRGRPLKLLRLLLPDMRLSSGQPYYAASDPRDIIFGLLGVASDADALGLSANYELTVGEVYALATKALLRQCTDYKLEFCTFPKNLHGLPSWVPDWQRIGRIGLIKYPISYIGEFCCWGTKFQPKQKVVQNSNCLTLRIKGFVVDTILAIHSPDNVNVARLPHTDADSAQEKRASAVVAILCFAAPYMEIAGGERALWRAVVAGSFPTRSCPMFDFFAPRIFQQTRIYAAELTDDQMLYVLENTMPHSLTLQSPLEDLQGSVDQLVNGVVRIAAMLSHERTLFVTSRGHFGLGPRDAVPGDLVTIIYGTAVPIILHPAGHQYRYAGDAYVHGMMYGEAAESTQVENEFEII